MKLGYILLYVDDVPRTAEFYERAFGLEMAFLHESGARNATFPQRHSLSRTMMQSLVREEQVYPSAQRGSLAQHGSQWAPHPVASHTPSPLQVSPASQGAAVPQHGCPVPPQLAHMTPLQ